MQWSKGAISKSHPNATPSSRGFRLGEPDGHINAFNIKTKTFLGQLVHRTGQPLQFDRLWSLLFVLDRLYFTAGINGEADGDFGFIVPSSKEETGGF